jgi:hypothetical protein
MPIVDFSQEDIDRSKVLEPAFYRCVIDSVEEKLSKDGTSYNYWLKGRVLRNADSGKEVSIPTPMWIFNSKAKSNIVAIFRALGKDISAGSRVEMNELQSKELDVFIGNEEYNGTMQNRINHRYRTPK